MTMRNDDRETLVQRWIIVTDASGSEHLEARWAVESRADRDPVSHAA
jgi:hypothetical protein